MSPRAKVLRASAAALRATADALDAEADALEAAPAAHDAADGERLVGAREAGVPTTTWRSAIRSGALHGVRVGRELRARRSDVAAWLASVSVAPRPPVSAPRVRHEEGDEYGRALSRRGQR